MHQTYPVSMGCALLIALCLSFAPSDLPAQLILERELIGAVAASTTTFATGDDELRVDASFGETIIGYEEGDIVITVGFHQTDDNLEGRFADLAEEEDDTSPASFRVNTFPNPTVETVTIDLGEHAEQFVELRLLDPNGRPVKQADVEDRTVITLDRLSELPNANYYLMAVDKAGEIHRLSTIMIVTH